MQRPRTVEGCLGEKTLIGAFAKYSSFVLCSADDWSCLKCGNINWARRSSCNICNAKKFADDQERTGKLVFSGFSYVLMIFY